MSAMAQLRSGCRAVGRRFRSHLRFVLLVVDRYRAGLVSRGSASFGEGMVKVVFRP